MSSRLNAAGRAALDAAFHLAIAHGGWVSPPDEPAVYGRPYDLRELPGDRECMEKCVAEADGTLLLIQGDTETESNVCRAAARKYGRPFLAIDLAQVPAFKASSLIADWLTGEKIAVLNVAGPEADEAANTYDKTFHMITSAYWLCQGKTEGAPARGPTRTDGGLPTSVTAAVALLITTMPLKDRATLANMTAGELAMLNVTLGAYIRNAFGLWSGNERLLESCRIVSGNLALSRKEAAGVIVRELWRELGQTHKLRIVK